MKRSRAPTFPRRQLLTLAGAPLLGFLPACGADEPLSAAGGEPWPGLRLDASRFGRWRLERGLPAFVYTADHEALAAWDRFVLPPTLRHFLLIGNRALALEVANDGTFALFDESEGQRWLVAATDDGGSGVSIVRD